MTYSLFFFLFFFSVSLTLLSCPFLSIYTSRLFIIASIHPSFYLSGYISICLPVCPVYLIYISIYPVYLSFYLSICPVCLSIYLSALSFYLSIWLSIWLSIYLFVYLDFSLFCWNSEECTGKKGKINEP